MKELIGNRYIAHSPNSDGEEQTMRQHSESVADIMSTFALSPEFADIYRYCGLVHDIGKYSDRFQRYIKGDGNSEPHAKWGAYKARKDKLMNAAFPIYGHHAGLPNREEMMETLEKCDQEQDKWKNIDNNMKDDDSIILQCDNTSFNSLKGTTTKELYVRMLYSALVDADSLDTEKHFLPQLFKTRPNLSLDIDALLGALNRRLDTFAQNSSLNKLRTEVRLYAQSLANSPLGCYSMTLPTGMGKTLCSLNWALHHAKSHSNIRRIVIVLPFISIIDQTAHELKSIFHDFDCVLEHHSNIIYEGNRDEDYYSKNPKQLATENWDYPIIITTAVQFFESLFSNQRSKCRKLHNLQDSIIIFDEIQTLPVNLAECTMRMLNDMLHLCRCSMLFCTATQPNFKKRNDFCGIDYITPLVKDPANIFAKTKRVEYHPVDDYRELSIDNLADKVVAHRDSVLIVCNTKKKAKDIFAAIKDRSDMQVLHLSTNMCPIHRMRIISKVKDSLRNGEKLILCSTQLIEAGVDMDFPIVYRELAPLESVIQSAGRCNREGKLDKGHVYLFQMEDKGQPSKQYETFAKYAKICYEGNESRLSDADFYTEYYTKIIKLYASEDMITPDRKKLKFENVSNRYHIIESNTVTLFVYKYDDDSLRLYNNIIHKEFLGRTDFQRISRYSIQVSDWFVSKHRDRISETGNGLTIWSGAYSPEHGLSDEQEIFII